MEIVNLLEQADVHFQKNEYDLAVKCLYSVLKIDPRNEDALLGMASVNDVLGRESCNNGNYKQASVYFSTAIKYDPKDEYANKWLTKLNRLVAIDICAPIGQIYGHPFFLIKIDGHETVEIPEGERITIYCLPGEYKAYINTGASNFEADFFVPASKKKQNFKISYSDGRLQIQHVLGDLSAGYSSKDEEADPIILEISRGNSSSKEKKKQLAFLLIALGTILFIVLSITLNAILPELHYKYGEKLLVSGDYTGAIREFSKSGDYNDAPERIKAVYYKKGEELFFSGDYAGALREFSKSGNYKDATERIKAVHYKNGEELFISSDYSGALTEFTKAGNYSDARKKREASLSQLGVAIFAGSYHTVGLKSDGTVVAVGFNGDGQCDVSSWHDIVDIFAANDYTLGLKSDGTVIATGLTNNDCDVSSWRDIVDISTNGWTAVGLKSDGTVVASGFNDSGQCNVSGWDDIVAISAGSRHTVGLKTDGTVVAVGSNFHDQCNVSGWRDIVDIVAAYDYTVGLKTDGTVVAVGDNNCGQCNVSGWSDIVAISAGDSCTVGLKADGTVVAIGHNAFGACDISNWCDIVAIDTGGNHTVGLKADGTVVAAGLNTRDQCNVSGWKLWNEKPAVAKSFSYPAVTLNDYVAYIQEVDNSIALNFEQITFDAGNELSDPNYVGYDAKLFSGLSHIMILTDRSKSNQIFSVMITLDMTKIQGSRISYIETISNLAVHTVQLLTDVELIDNSVNDIIQQSVQAMMIDDTSKGYNSDVAPIEWKDFKISSNYYNFDVYPGQYVFVIGQLTQY